MTRILYLFVLFFSGSLAVCGEVASSGPERVSPSPEVLGYVLRLNAPGVSPEQSQVFEEKASIVSGLAGLLQEEFRKEFNPSKRKQYVEKLKESARRQGINPDAIDPLVQQAEESTKLGDRADWDRHILASFEHLIPTTGNDVNISLTANEVLALKRLDFREGCSENLEKMELILADPAQFLARKTDPRASGCAGEFGSCDRALSSRNREIFVEGMKAALVAIGLSTNPATAPAAPAVIIGATANSVVDVTSSVSKHVSCLSCERQKTETDRRVSENASSPKSAETKKTETAQSSKSEPPTRANESEKPDQPARPSEPKEKLAPQRSNDAAKDEKPVETHAEPEVSDSPVLNNGNRFVEWVTALEVRRQKLKAHCQVQKPEDQFVKDKGQETFDKKIQAKTPREKVQKLREDLKSPIEKARRFYSPEAMLKIETRLADQDSKDFQKLEAYYSGGRPFHAVDKLKRYEEYCALSKTRFGFAPAHCPQGQPLEFERPALKRERPPWDM